MEELLQKQEQIGDKISTLQINYNKDGDSRKTKQYLEKRIEQLKALYVEYIKGDDEIQSNKPPLDQSHAYNIARTTISNTYKKCIDDMRQRLHNGPPSTPAPQSSLESTFQPLEKIDVHQTTAVLDTSSKGTWQTNNSSLQQMLRRQDVKMRELYREIDNAKEILKDQQGKQAMQFSLRYMKRAMEQIIDKHEEICVEASDNDQEELEYFTKEYYETSRREYTKIAIKMTTAIEENTTKGDTDMEIKLKPIEIPVFYGDYMKWGSFAEIFNKLIDQNQRLSNTHKINYLKTHLNGAAAKLICHLESTADNYAKAWSILNNRYNNRRLLISAYLNTLLNQPAIATESSAAIRNMHDTTTECLHAIENFGINVESWNSFLIFILLRKLDNETRRLYESSLKNPCEFQQTTEFLKFLEQRFKTLETSYSNRSYTQPPKIQPVKQIVATTTVQRICVYCQKSHAIENCEKFKTLPSSDRNQIILLHNLCRRCLATKHQIQQCRDTIRCSICNGLHHTILHSPNSQRQKSDGQEVKNFKLEAKINSQKENVLLATALVSAMKHDGNQTILRVLIDPGSQATFITEEAVQRLKLKGNKIHAKIAGVGNHDIGEVRKIVSLKIQPIIASKFELRLDALVFQKLTKLLPDREVEIGSWQHLNNLNYADPNYNKPGAIDILLGADYYPKIILNNIIKGGPDQPMAQKTELGWIVFGKYRSCITQKHRIHSMVSYVDLENQLKKFWEIEEVGHEREFTNDEEKCEQHFQNTCERQQDGTYQVALPFKENNFTLGESKRKAAARLIQVERKLNKNLAMKNEYTSFIEEYITLGHMEVINNQDDVNKGYFLPHHAVMKQDSSTTKLRVVFDASAKTSNGVSLNDLMYTGPTIQQELLEILLRWRKYKFVFKADIEKMFRQVKMRPIDQIYQLMLWRDQQGIISTYKMKTVTYGSAAATFLATRVLHQLAQDDGEQYPAAKKALTEDFYVDDILSGANTIEQALLMQQQLTMLLKQGGFNLRKWSSNNQEILKTIQKKHMDVCSHTIEIGETIKTLGIIWNPIEDIFQFKIKSLDTKAPVTKRKVLSETSKLFDPMGWLAPVIVKAKITMQQLWTLGLDWDTQLPNDLETKWISYVNQLQMLEEIKLQRWIRHDKEELDELHGFCDASEEAYAAVIYYKSNCKADDSKVTIVIAKTKVAPLKAKLTIPRLELCAAVLLARLLRKTKKALQLPNIKTFAWTDSMITLAWVRGKPNKYKTFVANRIVEIQSILSPLQWNYVKSEDNPADCASRGLNASKLLSHQLWWNGPIWLKYPQDASLQPQIEEATQEKIEIRTLIATTSEENSILGVIERCSSLTKAVRIIAYVRRFTRRTTKSLPKYLSTKELHDSQMLALKLTQQLAFKIVKNQLEPQSETRLRSLDPKIDENGLLRVGGRLSNARIAFNSQHPIILPYKSHLTWLLIDYAHKMTLHGGKTLTLAFIRQRYWIIKGPLAVKTYINKCIICYKQRAQTLNQIMGDFPIARVTPTRPFTHTGVDYAGPFQLRCSPGRGRKSYKGYLAVFICFAVKAIHIEVVSDLSSGAFIAAFKRFTARRGLCSNLYSDCGSNFIGASKLIRNELTLAVKQLAGKWSEELAKDGTQWHYIPPRAPHMGGLWESAVRSIKHHLHRIVGEQHLTFEEMTTVVCQIEACLNSRPLFPMTSDPNDFTTLTPGHFLIGEPMRTMPGPSILNENINHLTRWKLLQKITQEYWKIWITEYMLLLQKRSKWTKSQANISKGEMILVKDDNLPPGKWPLGRVQEVHTGNDGLVRVVTIKNSNGGLLKRPITKISRLPIEDNDQLEQIGLSKPNDNATEARQTSSAVDGWEADTSRQKQPIQHGRATRANSKLTLLLCTLAIIGMMGHTTALKINITRFPFHPGIYFDKIGQGNLINGEWRIISYYNLTSYWAELNHLESGSRKLDELCANRTLIPAVHADTFKYCAAIVSQIRTFYTELRDQNEIINALSGNKVNRQRRSPFDFVGTIANELFGVLDQRAGNTYKDSIDKLNSNQQHHQKLLQQQMSILETTINVIRHSHEETDNKFQAFNNIVTNIIFHEEFTDLALHAMMEMMILRAFQSTIIDTITEVHQGKLDPLILTPEQLQGQIKQIVQNLKPNQDVPCHNLDTAAIYKIINIKAIKVEETIIFEIKIPLVQRSRYALYHVIPVPTIHQQEYVYIRPSSNYLMVSLQQNQYMALTAEEFNTCNCLNGEYFCDVHQPLYEYNAYTTSCEIELLKQKEGFPKSCQIHKMGVTTLWIPLRRYNAWIFVTKSRTIGNLICEDDSGVIETTTQLIEGEGILELHPNCVLKGDTYTVAGYRTSSSRFVLSFMPQFNLSARVHGQYSIGVKTTSSGTLSEINAIEASLQDHKKDLESSTIGLNIHDYHHYLAIYLLIPAVLVTITCCLFRRIKLRTAVAQPQAPLPGP